MNVKKYVTWEEIEEYVQKAARAYAKYCDKNAKQQRGVWGPARGGIPYATLLSDMANMPILGAPCKDCLIIDDVADSGETLKRYSKTSDTQFNTHFISTMFYHPRSCFEPDYWSHKKANAANQQGDWLVYPYEEMHERRDDFETLRDQIEKSNKTNKQVVMTYPQLEGYLYKRYENFKKQNGGKDPVGVYGVPNGGELGAVWLSNAFDVPFLSAPCDNCLLIDDINKEHANVIMPHKRHSAQREASKNPKVGKINI